MLFLLIWPLSAPKKEIWPKKIKLRKINEDEVIKYYVDSDKIVIVDIPPGYTHNIENIGDDDMTAIFWANEIFNPNKPDTFYMEV